MKNFLMNILGNKYDESIVDFYIEIAQQMVCNYVNVNTVEQRYEGAITMLVLYLYNNADMLGISDRKEGDITISIPDIKIPAQIKAMLPKPKVRVL